MRAATLLLALIAVASVHHAFARNLLQVYIDSALDNSSLDKTLQTVICRQPQLSMFCQAINLARSDATVARLFDTTTVATLFAPTDRGINNTRRIMQAEMGVTPAELLQNAQLAAKFVRSHIVLGSKPLYTNDWRAGLTMYNSLMPQQALTVVEGSRLNGARRQFYIRSPLSNGRSINDRAGFQQFWNVIGGQGFVQQLENPIIPPAATA